MMVVLLLVILHSGLELEGIYASSSLRSVADWAARLEGPRTLEQSLKPELGPGIVQAALFGIGKVLPSVAATVLTSAAKLPERRCSEVYTKGVGWCC